MKMFKLIGTASCSLMALSMLVQPALAQVPNPGAGWMLLKQRQVRTFAANPAKPGSGAWQLVGVNNRTYFIEDGKTSRSLSSSRQESREVALGKGPKVYGPDDIVSRKKGEQLVGDVPNSRTSYLDKEFLVTLKLIRYALFEDVKGYKPWTIYNRAATETRSINYYLVQWTDPITNEGLSELDPTAEYTAWVQGAPFNKTTAASGREYFERRDSLGTDDRQALVGKTYVPAASLADVGSNPTKANASSFLSNQGAGNSQVSLSGSKLRSALGANDAVASKAKQASTGGSITDRRSNNANASAASTNNAVNASSNAAPAVAASGLIDKIQGTWQLSGGSKSKIKFEREGKSNNVKVKVNLDIVGGKDFEAKFNAPFSQTLSNTKDDRTISLQFNDDGTRLTMQLGRIKAYFVKQ